MKKVILLYFSMFLLLTSCGKGESDISLCENCNFTCLDQNETNVQTNDCQDNWECNFKVMAQSTVDLEETEGVSNGNKNVFQMFNSTEGSAAIADDEYTDILVFELDKSQDSFSVEDSELADMQVHFRRICYCTDTDFKPITIGCLQGEKQIDGIWMVQGYFGGTFEFGVDAQFWN